MSATAGAASAQSIRLGMGPRACSCPSCTQLAATARSLTLSFHRPEWNERWPEFSSEIRPAPKASGWRTRGGPLRGGSWDFQLRTDSVRDTVELRWSLEGLEDEGLDLSLIDLENGRIVDMHAQGVYRVQAAPAGVHRFRIVAQ